LTETVEGSRTVEALLLEARRFQKLNNDISTSYMAERNTLRLRTVFLPISDLAYTASVVMALLVGGVLYIHGSLRLAAATSVVLYVRQMIAPVDLFLFRLDDLQLGGASLARLIGVKRLQLREASRQPARARRTELSPAPNLTLSDVTFAYREGRPVLKNISLEISAGERLVIVGPSGAGKSTLGRLLAGIHSPDSGSITIGSVSLQELPVEHLRQHVALVTQEHHIFQGTLRDNLAIAKAQASDDEFEWALAAVHAHGWARRLGLGARVGGGGQHLSPAQAQQIALARLVLADPRILILDEATSMFDARAAGSLERSLAAVLEGRTVIVIAHRLHAAAKADRVAVMERGKITEIGSHDQLIQAGESYAALWHAWYSGPWRL
jgi:ABC-type multidrug transport system fused ATPase/permease subunit